MGGKLTTGHDTAFSLAHDAMDRMRRANERNTGCHLTREMIAALSITFMGEVWSQNRPDDRAALAEQEG